MMKRILNISMIIVLLALGLSSCYEQEVVAPITPGGLGYTSATFTTDFAGTELTEGDTIVYNIKLSKPLDQDLTFTVDFNGNPDDIAYEDVTIPAYSTEGVMTIIVVADDIPEKDYKVHLEVGVMDVGHKSLLVNTTNPVFDTNLKNFNDPDGLTLAVSWPNTDDDWDFYLIDEAGDGTPYGTDWVNFAAATGSDPEHLVLKDYGAFWTIDDGTYYLDCDPYYVSETKTPFTVSIGYPDQSIEFINFTFENSKAGDYPITWGYSALKIVKSGTNYTVSLNPEFE